MTRFDRAGEFLFLKLRRAAGKPAVWRRGEESVSLTIVPAQSNVEADGDYGATLQTGMQDVLALAEELVIAGQPVEPESGDIVEFDGRRYEVADLVGGACWSWHGRPGYAYRLHTQPMGAIE